MRRTRGAHVSGCPVAVHAALARLPSSRMLGWNRKDRLAFAGPLTLRRMGCRQRVNESLASVSQGTSARPFSSASGSRTFRGFLAVSSSVPRCYAKRRPSMHEHLERHGADRTAELPYRLVWHRPAAPAWIPPPCHPRPGAPSLDRCARGPAFPWPMPLSSRSLQAGAAPAPGLRPPAPRRCRQPSVL